DKRPDLVYCGRTLFGSRPPKGQEMEDHYFGAIKPRVAAFMEDLDKELWQLGVLSKTRHNEVSPAQHELAPIFSTTNIAADHNQLTMEMMQVVAARHGLVCLLHEKPFAGVNGSGKHNNWSLGTEDGRNLLDTGETPLEHSRFLLFMTAVIKAVDEHQDLLRLSIASAGNDHRLGANEAPPAIVSIFLGDELTEMLNSIKNKTAYMHKEKTEMEIGVDALPHFSKDITDRNRTSPFAFTGNKFEFRMPGSSLSISGPNIVLNTIVADALCQFADILEKAEDFNSALDDLIRDAIEKHQRIIFNGNNYSAEWVIEAEKRGLLNLPSTVESLPLFASDYNIDLFERLGVFSESEVRSRTELLLESYSKIIHIEALTMLDMAKRDIVPAVLAYSKKVADTIAAKKNLDVELECTLEEYLLIRLSKLSSCLHGDIEALENSVLAGKEYENVIEHANYNRSDVFLHMQSLRSTVDELETLVGSKYWPYPSYGEILYSVR
ncbi:MAG: glutamine synthetase type III, partial [Syntrophomonadaceae bacterium]|nr:glutamine synthetase type III [Syntrophomonadaceae bacterium]